MEKITWVVFVCLASLAFVAGGAWGDNICVDPGGGGDYTELQDALTAAQVNDADDIIQVVQGVHSGNFIYSSGEGHSISLLGGYTAGCASRVIYPANTVLDAEGSGRVLDLNNADGGDIMLEGFTIQHGALDVTGGGIYASSSSTGDSGDVTIQTNTIVGNTGGPGVHVYATSLSGTSGDVTLTDNTIFSNTAISSGGGVYARTETSTGTAGAVTLTENTICDNTGVYAGGVDAGSYASSAGTAGAVTLTGNIIIENSADQSYGGVRARSLSTSGDSGAVTLVNNIIAGNTATAGETGGVDARSVASGTADTVTLTNNTITGNSAATNGGGVSLIADNTNQTVNCYNNIIWGNTAPTGGDIMLTGTAGTAIASHNNYTDISGSWDSEGTRLNEDPAFIDPDYGDYRLRSTSGCINAGTDTAPYFPGTDFEGDSRPIDGDYDIGADEVSVLTTCVSNYTELDDALDAADGNNINDVIMVEQGTYSENFSYNSSQGYDISVLGGYTSGCASRMLNPANTILDGGDTDRALYLNDNNGADITVDGFTLQGGDTAGDGGGVYVKSTSTVTAGNVSLTNNIITGNTAAQSGGGAYARSYSQNGTAGTATLLNNIIIGNSADANGGGVFVSSYSVNGTPGTVTCTNNTISGNTAGGNGGGVTLYADSSFIPGGIVNCYNNIIRGNTATSSGNDINLIGTGTAYGYNNNYSGMVGSWDYGTGTNIDADPLFVDPGYWDGDTWVDGDYHLLPLSPCIDTGTNAAPSLPSYDFEGDDRIINGDNDASAHADIGADEFTGYTPPCDYDGDGLTDIGVYRPSNGAWYLKRSDLGSQTVYWGGDANDVPTPEDYDGDGGCDLAVYRSTTGWWYIKGVGSYLYGAAGDIPIPADYDGDGAIDFGVYRPSTGWWYVKDVGQFLFGGLADDIPVPGDYDGDGSIDVAVYRSSTGWWYVKGVGQFLFGGLADDIPVPGDYDGDGTTDIALFRPSTGWWYIKDVGSYLHGQSGDIPVPGDYDGDGTTDIGVFRPSNGRWYIRGESTFPIWGQSGDTPLTRNVWIWQETGLLP